MQLRPGQYHSTITSVIKFVVLMSRTCPVYKNKKVNAQFKTRLCTPVAEYLKAWHFHTCLIRLSASSSVLSTLQDGRTISRHQIWKPVTTKQITLPSATHQMHPLSPTFMLKGICSIQVESTPTS
jgi:hypothetical protein